MTRRTKPKSNVLKAWQIESLRLTAFPSPAYQFTDPSWWKELVGEAPERKIQFKIGGQREEGLFGPGMLILNTEPSRIDWILTQNPKNEEYIPLLGGFSEVLDPFFELMRRWLEKGHQIQRLAFGAILQVPADNRESGYKELSKYLRHVKLDPINSSDFLYQINRPRDTKLDIKDLRINRLTKWSVSSWKLSHLSFGSEVVKYPSVKEEFACRLELDINTATDYPYELPPKKLNHIFQELVELGKEIAIKGDIP